jgi:hypothetical protein
MLIAELPGLILRNFDEVIITLENQNATSIMIALVIATRYNGCKAQLWEVRPEDVQKVSRLAKRIVWSV